MISDKQHAIAGHVARSHSRNWRVTLLTATSLLALSVGTAPAQTVIDGGTTVDVPGSQASPWNVGTSLTVGGAGVGGLNIWAGSVVTSPLGIIGDMSGSSGTVSVSGIGATWTNTGPLTVGENGTGTLTISAGGTVSDAEATVGNNSEAVGKVTVTGPGSSWTTGELTIADGGHGELSILDQAAVTASSVFVGRDDKSTGGFLTVDGKGSLTATANLTVGGSAPGTMTISNGGKVSDKVGTIGEDANAVGTATVSGSGSHWTNSQYLYVAHDGTGSLTIENWGEVSGVDIIIGNQGGSNGAVIVTGTGTRLKSTDNLAVGLSGNGSLTIEKGGAVTDIFGAIGETVGSNGEVTVTGADSSWTNTGDLQVGGAGFGTLNIENGGAVSSFSGNVGVLLGSDGKVLVSGPHSTLETSGNLNIGIGGSGLLTVKAGGTVDTGADAYIGYFPGGLGYSLVTGAGSTWSVGGSLHIGGDLANSALGTLTIADGGTVTVGNGNGTVHIAQGPGYTSMLDIGANPFGVDPTAIAPGALKAGVVQLGASGGGVVHFNHTGSNYVFAPRIEGQGAIRQLSGTTVATGNSGGFTGATDISGGRLLVNGTLGGSITVLPDGALGGSGTAAGPVTIAGGGTLIGRSGQTLTMDTLTLANGSSVSVTLGAPSSTRLFNVTGKLTLDGTLDVANAGGFGAGVYRIFDYGGILTDNGFALGTTPAGTHAVVQTAIAKQVNIVVDGSVIPGSGPAIQFWNGTRTVANGMVNGGSGIWSAGPATNWTDANGATAAAWGGQFAVFQGTVGNVTVDGAVATTGMQFIGQGWTVAGDALTLAGDRGVTVIRVGDGSAAGAGYRASIAAPFTGSSRLVKDDLGTLVLTGDSSGFSGPTAVWAGALTVDGKLGGTITLLAEGRLQGSGSIGGLEAAGTIAPGNSIGTLAVAGDIAFAAGSTYEVEVDAAGRSDRIAAAGTATIEGGTVKVLAGAGDYASATTYTILTAKGGRTGTFAGVSSNLIFLDPTLTYDPTSVYLRLTRNGLGFADVGATPNQIATAGGAESLGPGNDIYDAVLNLSAAQARAAFDQLSGEVHASARTALVEDSRFVREAATNRIRAAFAGVGAASAPVMAYGPDGRAHGATADTDHFAAWGEAFGSWGTWDGDGNAARLSRSTGGLLVGADGFVDDTWRLGVLAGYSNTSFDVSDRLSSGSSDNYHLGLYGGGQWGALGFRSGFAYTWHDISTERSVAFPGFGDSLGSGYGAGTTQLFGELGYGIKAGEVAFEPFANLAYVNLHTDGIGETRGAAALSGAAANTDTTVTTLGLRAATAFSLGGIDASARTTLGWRHAFGDTTPVASLAFAGGDAFAIAGVPIARDAALVEAGLDVALSPAATFGLSYGGQFGSGLSDQFVKANFSLEF